MIQNILKSCFKIDNKFFSFSLLSSKDHLYGNRIERSPETEITSVGQRSIRECEQQSGGSVARPKRSGAAESGAAEQSDRAARPEPQTRALRSIAERTRSDRAHLQN